jgi:hypothetical protein
MVVLTLIFVGLYGAALVGWLKPLADEKMVLRIENVNAALTSTVPTTSRSSFAEDVHKTDGPIKEDGLRYSVGAALRILNS